MPRLEQDLAFNWGPITLDDESLEDFQETEIPQIEQKVKDGEQLLLLFQQKKEKQNELPRD